MGKKHLTPAEINYKEVFERAVAIEVRRQMEEVTMDERVVRAIRATHKADLIISLNVLLDCYKWESNEDRKTFCHEYLSFWKDCLKQYDEGELCLKQMVGHIQVCSGIDIEKWADGNMDFADIKEKKNGTDEHI